VQLAAARAHTERLVRGAACRFVTPPAGLFGWIDVGVDTDRLALRLLDEGWLTAPGSLFHATPRPTTLMRINFASAQDSRFWRRLRAAPAS
jgi:DNA-binding transcriptional MocR family regulator